MFVDRAEIHIKAGKGGDGAVSFHREKYVASGGPDGGDGGKGGSVIFVVDDNLSTLFDFRYKRKYAAADGANGSSNRKSGRKGEDLVIRVPRGTLIREKESQTILADMSSGEPFTAARGGRGGWGNTHFANPTRQTPRFAKNGAPGESWEIVLELKLLADVGLIGFPNVGKSTLISVVSNAKPEIADYHFTTLTPVLGVISLGEGDHFVMADIPGLIEGAGNGAGLGHEFLRHVERCRLLIHVLDAAGSEGRDPVKDFDTINAELAVFNPELSALPQIVAGNKIDLVDPKELNRLERHVMAKGCEFYPLCAPIGEGTKPLMQAVAAKLKTLPPVKVYDSAGVPAEWFEKRRESGFSVTVHDGVFFVEAEWLLGILRRVDLDDYESLQYFQRLLVSSGIIDALASKGIKQGDTVSIYDFEFEYVP